MSKNPSDHPTTSQSGIDEDTPRKTVGTEIKQQSGRPPARPPYEQYLRVSKVVK